MMKRKRYLAIFVSAFLAMFMFTGCSGSMKDGTYRAEYKDFDDHGWKDYVTITVSDGKITEVDYDAVNDNGDKKSADEAYREQMEPISNTYPAKFYKELEDQLVDEQDLKKVDAVAGATNSSNDFKILGMEAMKAAKSGQTDTIIVER